MPRDLFGDVTHPSISVGNRKWYTVPLSLAAHVSAIVAIVFVSLVAQEFVPTEFEERDGKPVAVKMNFGPGMENRAVVTVWDPPRMFAAESPGWTPEMPSMAIEWSVEARAGGVCLVRVVNSLFASTDDWDNQLEGTESGWPGFFRILRLYLAHFPGQRVANMQWFAPAAGSVAEAWEKVTAALGLTGIGAGQRWAAPAGAPALGGVVEHTSRSPCEALLRLDKPGPGVAALGAVSHGGTVLVTLSFYLYGEQASEVAARETPRWQAWIDQQFPMPSGPGEGG